MTALDDAVKAALDGECEREMIPGQPVCYGDAPEEYLICSTHACDWDEDEESPCYEHRKIADAVRAGWAAAMESLRLGPECPGCSCDPHAEPHAFCQCEGFEGLPEGDQP